MDACWKIEAINDSRLPSRLAYLLFHNATQYNETFEYLKQLHGSKDKIEIIPSHCLSTWRRLGNTKKVIRD